MYSSFARLYIFILFCFGLSACLLFFVLFSVFAFGFVFLLYFVFFLFTLNVRRLSMAK